MHIIFVASEAAPLAKTGGLADVVGSLPGEMIKMGHEVRVIMPYYRRQIDGRSIPIRHLADMRVWMDGAERLVPLHEAEINGLSFLLVEQDELYDRPHLYGPPGGEFPDNPLRFGLLCRATLAAAIDVIGPVDVFHCHDWQAGLLPLLLNEQYRHFPALAKTATVLTIHNLAYQGVFGADWIGRLGLPSHFFHPDGIEFHGYINCMKAGILAADGITTVSPHYAEEILTPEYGCQLEGFLASQAHKLSGIVNGLDTSQWDPITDKALAAPFQAGKMAGKAACKAILQQRLKLEADANAPLLAVISRLAEQKGVDLLTNNISGWMDAGHQLAVLGTGAPYFEKALHELADKYAGRFAFHAGFDESLARQIYAGSDMFLMPSRFEPCGLGQLIAMRYGSIPVVRATGGLYDTVADYGASPSAATGFSFESATPEALAACVASATDIFVNKKPTWKRLQGRAMRRDSSWHASATRYAELYEELARASV